MFKLRFFQYKKDREDAKFYGSFPAAEIPKKGHLVFFGENNVSNKADSKIYRVVRVLRCYSAQVQDLDKNGSGLSVEVEVVPNE